MNVLLAVEDQSEEAIDANPETPPRLVFQMPASETTQISSTVMPLLVRNERMANNQMPNSYPIRSSASACAQYLKACEELSRIISKFKLSDDDLMGCLKYSLISYCLGNAEMAAQKIIFGLVLDLILFKLIFYLKTLIN